MTRQRVLIVDDNAQVRQELHTVLALAGEIDVIGEATDGREAIQQAKSLRPDVVVMDLEMPVLDGYEATRQIKILAPQCRVVALTVHSYEVARQKAGQAGVDAFIVKGAPVNTLVQAISEKKE